MSSTEKGGTAGMPSTFAIRCMEGMFSPWVSDRVVVG